jgi:hypothetical protein
VRRGEERFVGFFSFPLSFQFCCFYLGNVDSGEGVESV